MIIATFLQVIYMLILIMAVFFLCWTPILTYNTLAAFELLGFGNSGKIFSYSRFFNQQAFHCDTGTGRTKHLKTTFSLLSYLNRLVQFSIQPLYLFLRCDIT